MMKTAAEKQSLVGFLRDKHRRALKKQKGVIIDELCQSLGVTRKHAIKLLSPLSVGRPQKPVKQGRPPKYQDKAFQDALRIFWKLTKQVCGRRLKSAIPLWINAVEEARGKFSPDVRQRLLQVSAPTIDRLLQPHKKLKGKSGTRNGGFRDEIPIQGNIWDIKIPGYMETDTVAHCGGSLAGEFINSVTMVDIATLWTECRAIYGKGSNAVFDVIRDIEDNLPFSMQGYDADNGGEVLNRQLFNYFVTERLQKGLAPVPMTRSRAYKKNDNCYVEQRNDSLPRRYLGYQRMDFYQLVPLINHYYANLVCPFINHFLPSFKLEAKVKVLSRIKRIYPQPVTPYQRLMESAHLSQTQKNKLKAVHDSLNPVKLSRQIDVARKLIDDSTTHLKAAGLLPKNLPHYQLSNPIIPQQNNVSPYQISHHAKKLESPTPHIFRYDDL